MFFFFLGARELLDSPELDRFAHALELVQTRYPAMTLSMLSTLFAIGMSPRHEGEFVSVSDLVARLRGQKYSTIARQLELLGEGNARTVGMDLIEKREDPHDRRTRCVAISASGRLLFYELDAVLAPDLLTGVGSTEARVESSS